MKSWHPCMQMKTFETNPALEIKSASGPWITLTDNRKIFDAISSWWCKSLGHNHPRLKQALKNQADKFEHVIFANTRYEAIDNLCEKLTDLMPNFNKVFFASDGASSIEISMKMSIQAMQIKGKINKTKFLSLENSYHGDTAGALSVSDVGKFKDPFKPLTFETYKLKDLPYVTGVDDPSWHSIADIWPKYLAQLEPLKDSLAAIICEPIVQGAGGIKIYSPDLLRRLSKWCKQNDVYLIADEIMTGIGRTGKMSACEHANIQPDFACYSKGLTSGWIAFSVCVTTDEVYDLFYSDDISKAFLHSHTYSGNALAASIALETLNIFSEENICEHVNKTLAPCIKANMQNLISQTKIFHNFRSIGAIGACDILPEHSSILPNITKKLSKANPGALIRPIGNTFYIMPPLNSSVTDINKLFEICISNLTLAKHAIF